MKRSWSRLASVGRRPHVILKLALSLDGFLDDVSDVRRVFSSAEDLAAVDRLRATCDAILVGAETIRRDRPRLMLRDRLLTDERAAQGRSPHPLKVTLSSSGELDAENPFFSAGGGHRLVYVPTANAERVGLRLGSAAEVVPIPDEQRALRSVLEHLGGRGVGRVLIDGGGRIAADVLRDNLADEARIAVAPIVLGIEGGTRVELPPEVSCALAQFSLEQLGDTLVFSGALSREAPISGSTHVPS